MTHRAEQIIDAIANTLREYCDPLGVAVHAMRAHSLAESADELPAITVMYAGDDPVPDESGLDIEGTINSVLSVIATPVVADIDEQQMHRRLLSMRALIHEAINRDNALGVRYVVGVNYGGAAEPEVDSTGDQHVGALPTAWWVRYEMGRFSAE